MQRVVFSSAVLCLSFSSCSAPVTCGPGTHLEGALCVANGQTADGGLAVDAGLPDSGTLRDAGASTDGGPLYDLKNAPDDWSTQRGTALTPGVTGQLPGLTDELFGGLRFVSAQSSVLGVSSGAHACDGEYSTCSLKWVDPTGAVTQTLGPVLAPSHLDFSSAYSVLRTITPISCNGATIRWGTGSLLNLETGALSHDFGDRLSQVSIDRTGGYVWALGYPQANDPSDPAHCTWSTQKKLNLSSPFQELTTDLELAAVSPTRFTLGTTVDPTPPRVMQVVEYDTQHPTTPRVLFSVEDADQYSRLEILDSDESRVVINHLPSTAGALGTVSVVDRVSGTTLATQTPAGANLRYAPKPLTHWWWFCAKPQFGTVYSCTVQDALGVTANQTFTSLGVSSIHDDLWLSWNATTQVPEVYDAAAARVIATLPGSFDDLHTRVTDAQGVHDFGTDVKVTLSAEYAPIYGHLFGTGDTAFLTRKIGSRTAFEAWHRPSGRHVRLTSSAFAPSNQPYLCQPAAVPGVGPTHPGLYSFVEPSSTNPEQGELFIGDAALTAPPRSAGLVALSNCRQPRASVDGHTVAIVQKTATQFSVTRVTLP